MGIEDIKKNINIIARFYRAFKRASINEPDLKYGKYIGIFLAVLFFGLYFTLPLGLNNYSPTINNNLQNSIGADVVAKVRGESEVCYSYPVNEIDWALSSYKTVDADGYYCPKRYSSYPFPQIWLNEALPGNFESINISAVVLNESGKTTTPGPMIVSFGKDPEIWKLYAFEENPQMVGFEKTEFDEKKIKSSLSRVDPKVLPWPVKYGSQVDLSITKFIIEQNEISFAFKFSYNDAENGMTRNKTLTYDNLYMPVPELEKTTFQLGIGTSKGTCIKPVIVSVCY